MAGNESVAPAGGSTAGAPAADGDETMKYVTARVTATAAVLTCGFGVLGNVAVLIVIGRNAHRVRVKSVANCYIWTLALADLLYVLALPLVAWATLIDR